MKRGSNSKTAFDKKQNKTKPKKPTDVPSIHTKLMKSLPSYRARNYQTTVLLPGKEIKMRLDTRNVIFQNKFIDNVVSICLLALELCLKYFR